MTEDEWLAGTQPNKMLASLGKKHPRRKFRLFSCAACRRVWGRLPDARSRNAVETAERWADGIATREEVYRARDDAALARHLPSHDSPHFRPAQAAYSCIADSAFAVADLLLANRGMAGRQGMAALLRDIFGNPFRAASWDPVWRSADVVPLAEAAYDGRSLPSGELDPGRLAVLSDALEEAGCDDAAILEHLRGPGPHVRGCWVVDLILRKG